VINGRKRFVTVGDVADYLIVLADVARGHARRCSSSMPAPPG
jgi:alkylation response protein AidB-like acyl-CoA dehydrogenase